MKKEIHDVLTIPNRHNYIDDDSVKQLRHIYSTLRRNPEPLVFLEDDKILREHFEVTELPPEQVGFFQKLATCYPDFEIIKRSYILTHGRYHLKTETLLHPRYLKLEKLEKQAKEILSKLNSEQNLAKLLISDRIDDGEEDHHSLASFHSMDLELQGHLLDTDEEKEDKIIKLMSTLRVWEARQKLGDVIAEDRYKVSLRSHFLPTYAPKQLQLSRDERMSKFFDSIKGYYSNDLSKLSKSVSYNKGYYSNDLSKLSKSLSYIQEKTVPYLRRRYSYP